MKKKFFALTVAFMMVAGIAGYALSGGATCSGKVTKVEGDKVTIELETGKASSLSVGDSVKLEKKKVAPALGEEEEFLLGC
jgi:hypothetical protein